MIKSLVYKKVLKPIFFLFDPELVHDTFLRIGKLMGSFLVFRIISKLLFSFSHPKLEQKVVGIDFKNPVGLSAGFDKDAELINILPSIGFGFMQIGSVTAKPYKGNPKPRLHRLKKSKSIVVYYGLKNIGVVKIVRKIKENFLGEFPISISIAKTNADFTSTTPSGIKDYVECFKHCVKEKVGDFYTINISCPNTFGGEPFNTPAKLDKLLTALLKVKTDKPVFVKMPIDLPWTRFEKLLEVIVKHKIHGVIIGNLSKDTASPNIKDPIPKNVKGGMSGKLTWDASNMLISKTYKKYGNKLIIVGVGGIFSAEDAYEKIKRGSTLVQIITGMIFEGPHVIGDINRGLVKLLEKDGYSHISEAIGASHSK